jgi:hypothetical protein
VSKILFPAHRVEAPVTVTGVLITVIDLVAMAPQPFPSTPNTKYVELLNGVMEILLVVSEVLQL